MGNCLGSSVRHPDLHQIARQTIDANANANSLLMKWILLKLNSKCIPQNIPIEADRIIPTEAELCLLICSLFPEGFRLPIEDLVIYGMALEVFEDAQNMIEARCRVHGLIKIINHELPPRYMNKLCLWEDKYGFQYVKVLYCVNDLAKSIASKYQLEFGSEILERRWPVTNWFECLYGLSLVRKGFNERNINLKCPQLGLLQLQHKEDSQSIPIKELVILSLDISSLPKSLTVLCYLRTLRFSVLKLEDMSWIGSLVHLEVVSISTSSLSDIPKEMGLLSNLRLLDLRKMNIAYIPPGVFSRMLKLEELYFPLSFGGWGCREKEHDDCDEWESWEEDDYDNMERRSASTNQINGEERINSSISEIPSLSLNALQISIPKASVLPKKSSIFKNIQQFKICVLNNLKYKVPGRFYSSNVLQLTGDAYNIKESGICDLMSRAEDLNLTRVRNLKNGVYELGDYGFPQLENMLISECDELEYVVDTTEKQILSDDDYLFSKLESLHLSILYNLKEIWHGRCAKLQRFENLSQISIRFCHKLKYVFRLSIIRGCALLKRIEILDCNEMEGIFYQDEEDDDPVVRYFIEELDLHSLPKLVGFLVCNDTTFNWVHDGTNQFTTNEVSSIRNKDVISHTMYNAFSSKLTEKWLQNMKRLKIAFCEAVKVIFLFEENHVTTRAFNSLKELELYGLRNLTHIWFSVPSKIIAFQNLQLLVLSECQNIYLFSPRVAKLMVQLQKVYINRCDKMKEIIVKADENEMENEIMLPRLKLLELQHMHNLRNFSSGIYPIELPSLDTLKFNQCNKMESFSYGSLSTPMLKRIQINGSSYPISGDLNATIERYMMGNCFGTPSNYANPNSQISKAPDSLNCSTISPNRPTQGSLNDTCDDSSSVNSIPASQGSVNPSRAIKEAKLEGPNYMKEFTFSDLNIATENFNSANLLGQGGFGKVYKGWLKEGTFSPSKTGTGIAIAVKKLDQESHQRFDEWQSEVRFLEMQSHPNVVKLLGHCWEDKKLLLVYEFMQRGSLDIHLFRRNKTLNWDMRIKIAIGVARGLDFLHTSRPNVIHRDIKSASILVDRNYNAKLTDFGLARLGPSVGDSHVSTVEPSDSANARFKPSDGYSHVSTGVQGTPGYAAPEYIATGRLYIKSDVYSFGMVLLELMTGLMALDKNRPEGKHSLVDWVKPFVRDKKKLGNIIDKRIQGQYSLKTMLLTAQLSLTCLESQPQRRPSMKEVLDALKQIQASNEKTLGDRRSSGSSNSKTSYHS